MILSRLKSIKIIKKYLKIFSRDIENCEEITRIDRNCLGILLELLELFTRDFKRIMKSY